MAIANQLRSLSLLTLLSSSLLLAACGGGGSGGGNTSSSTSSTPASSSSVSSASSSSEAPAFTLGGSLEGLAGTGLQLANGEESLALSSNGNFAFTTALHQGDSYNITIAQQPSAPNQTCTLTNASGTVDSANVTNLQVSCTTNTYTVGGSVSGLTTTGLVLQNNAGDDLTVNADGNFAFATALADQSAFSVSVKTQPEKHLCSVTGASGNLAGANISSVTVSCLNAPAAPTLALAYGPKLFKFTWDAVDGATHYKLLENADGSSGYAQVGDDLTATSYDEEVTLFNRIGAQYTLEACNQAGCNTSGVVNVSEYLEEAIGFIQPQTADSLDYVSGENWQGISLSGDGTTLAISAYGDDSGVVGDPTDNSMADSGAVYVYQKVNGRWMQEAYLKASNADAGDYFGASVSLSENGQVLVIGAPEEKSSAQGVNQNASDNSVDGAGAAYVFVRNGSQWEQTAYLKPKTSVQAQGRFGQVVKLSADGQTLAIGATGEFSTYVFSMSSGEWLQQARLEFIGELTASGFGSALSLSANGNRMAIGVYSTFRYEKIDDNSDNDLYYFYPGAVNIYDRDGESWVQTATVSASGGGSDDYFGYSVALSANGTYLAVGAPGEASGASTINGDYEDNSLQKSGAVYLFSLKNDNWEQQTYFKASNPQANANVGESVAISDDGSLLAASASGEYGMAVGLNGDQQDLDSWNHGAVYIFHREDSKWVQSAYIKSTFNILDENLRFGKILALSGDGSCLAVGSPDAPKDNDVANYDISNIGGVYLY